MKAFKTPKKFLAHLDADAVAAIVSTAADLALVVDPTGVIRDVACANPELIEDLGGTGTWTGRRWADTVTAESRAKLEAILKEATGRATRRWRQVDYPHEAGGPPTPILFCAVPTGQNDRLLVLGRDLRPVSALQQQLIDAQHSMERDYARLRHVETRYRLLFLTSSEPVLVVDVATQKILEFNPAAARLLGIAGRLVRHPFMEAFDDDGARSVQALLSSVKASGRPEAARARLADGQGEVEVAVSLLRQDDTATYLVRIGLGRNAAAVEAPHASVDALLLQLARKAPDGFVVTDPQGQILAANDAFLEMAQLTSSEQMRSESIERWLGRSGVDLSVLIANLRQRGRVRLFATTLRAEHGPQSDVEISAVAMTRGDQRCLGFLIRAVGRRVRGELAALGDMPRSVEQLTELIGRVSLKQLVREATEVVERLAIEAALRLTDDNRASAAEILGLSRQSLYVKLRRYGLADGLAIEGGSV